MYGIFTYIGVIIVVNVGKYSMEHLGMGNPCFAPKPDRPPSIAENWQNNDNCQPLPVTIRHDHSWSVQIKL